MTDKELLQAAQAEIVTLKMDIEVLKMDKDQLSNDIFNADMNNEILESHLQKAKSEIKRLERQLDEKCDRCIARDRAEAIKEFAEKLKKESFYPYIENDAEFVSVDDIDKLVKEMVNEEME